MNKKMTISSIKKSKGLAPLVMITAYDALFASLFEESCDMILVGDSLNMSFAGKKDTLSATMDQMIYHTNADCVKIEGGGDKADIVEHLTSNGIAVCGHIGLLPQSVRSEGGYKVKGKTSAECLSLIADARAIEDAGAFCMVIEGVIAEVAQEVAASVDIPVIGIGAGNKVDGQVLVFSDMLGLFEAFTPKFVKKYMDGASLVKEAVKSYAGEVKVRDFPATEHTY